MRKSSTCSTKYYYFVLHCFTLLCAGRKRLDKLRAVGDPIRFRASEVGAREQARLEASNFASGAIQSIKSWNKTKPWINETQRADILKEVRPRP